MSGDLPRFHLDLEDNQDGWGKDERSPSRRFVRLRALPCCVLTPVLYEKKKPLGPIALPKDLEDLPYAPFQKDNKLGRVADFTQQQGQQQRGRTFFDRM